MITPNAGKDVEKLDHMYLAGGSENFTASLEVSMAFSCKVNHALTKKPTN